MREPSVDKCCTLACACRVHSATTAQVWHGLLVSLSHTAHTAALTLYSDDWDSDSDTAPLPAPAKTPRESRVTDVAHRRDMQEVLRNMEAAALSPQAAAGAMSGHRRNSNNSSSSNY
jgi:hypothetical protein